GPLLPIVAVGGTLMTTRLKVTPVEAPSLSVAVIVTVWLWAGPSVVLNDQFQVPSTFSVTVPTEAIKVTMSTPGSLHVPVLLAVWPSSTVTPALSRVTVGGALLMVMVVV